MGSFNNNWGPAYFNSYGKNSDTTLLNQVASPDKKFEFFPENPQPAPSEGVTLVSITVTPSNATLNTTDTLQFTATGTYSDSSTLNLTSATTWTSSNNSLATVTSGDSGGVVTGVAAGSVIITATLGSVVGHTGLTLVAPLTIISYQDTGFADTETPLSSSSFTWETGDVFLVICQTLNAAGPPFLPPTDSSGSLSFTLQVNNPLGEDITVYGFWVSTATATSSNSGVITCSFPGASPPWGFAVWQIRNASGIGNIAYSSGLSPDEPVVSLTSSQEGSGIFWVATNRDPDDGTTLPTPIPTTTRENLTLPPEGRPGNITLITAEIDDQVLTTPVDYGLTNSNNFYWGTVVVCEIKT